MTYESDLAEPDDVDVLSAELARLRQQNDDSRIGVSVFIGALMVELARTPNFDGEGFLNRFRTDAFATVENDMPGVAQVLAMILQATEGAMEGEQHRDRT